MSMDPMEMQEESGEKMKCPHCGYTGSMEPAGQDSGEGQDNPVQEQDQGKSMPGVPASLAMQLMSARK